MDTTTKKRFLFRIFPFLIGSAFGCILTYMYFYQAQWNLSITNKKRHFMKEHLSPVGHSVLSIAPGALTVLCIVIIKSKNAQNLISVSGTYATRCNQTLYYANSKPKLRKTIRNNEAALLNANKNSATYSPEVKIIEKSQGKAGTWEFLHSALKDLTRSTLDHKFDWVIIVDEKTFVILENLKRFAESVDPRYFVFAGNRVANLPSWIRRLFPFWQDRLEDYLRGESGYLINQKLFERLLRFSVLEKCEPPISDFSVEEDVGFARCIKDHLNIYPYNANDISGHKFVPFSPKKLFYNHGIKPDANTSFFWPISKINQYTEDNYCCSDNVITFGNLNHKEFRMLEYILYKLKPFGIK